MITILAGFADAASSVRQITHRMTRGFRYSAPVVGALFLAGFGGGPASGQNYLTSTGMPTFSTPEPVELGFVDASSGNLHLSLPLGSYPQRAGQSQPVTLEYDSNIWEVTPGGGTPTWAPGNGPAIYGLGGWYLSYQVETGELPNSLQQNCTTDEYWMDRNGTTHAFHLATASASNCPSAADAFATDSSGFHMYYTNAFPNTSPMKVYAPDGTLVWTNPPSHDPQGNNIVTEDTNGNYLSLDSHYANLYDTLYREIASEFLIIGGNSTATVSTSQGTSQYTFATTTINVKSDFQQSGVLETTTSIPVIRSLTLPDAAHSTYYFTYDCDSGSGNAACGSPTGESAYYGELISITLPTGGTVEYSYTTFSDAYSNKSRWVNQRQAAGGYWYYTPQVLSTCTSTQVNCQQQTTVQSPAGTTVYTYNLNNGAWPTQVLKKDSQGNTLSTTNNYFDFSQSCVLIGCHGASYVRLLTTQTIVPGTSGNLVKQTQYTYDSPQHGNQTAIKEWRYVPINNGFPSVPDRATYISYLTTGTNDINKPTSVTLCGNVGSDSACPGGGSRVSQTLYTYDAYGTGGLILVAGIAHHDDTNFGAAYTTRGNVTAQAQWVSGSTYLTTSYGYDTTGQVRQEADPAGNVTTFAYTDSFYTDPGNNSSPSAYTPQYPTNAYLTSVTDAIGAQTGGYYWGSGNAAQTKDYNGQNVISHYQDGLDRATEEVDPIGWKLGTYSSSTQSDMYTAVGDTSPSVGCSSCQHTQTILDIWGRTSSQILVNNPIGQVNVDSTYDQYGQLLTQSHPYSGSGDPNHVFESFGYDALGRQLSTTHPDGEAQQAGFGNDVVPLGGVASQQGAATTYGYGYPQISEDEALRQRQQWVDGFGRIIEVDEPTASTSSVATTTVGISSNTGLEEQQFNPCQQYGGNCPQTAWNSGYVYLTVDGFTAQAFYGPNGGGGSYTTLSEVTSALISSFNDDPSSPVTASAGGSGIILTAKGPGVSGNFSFSSSETWDTGSCPPYNPCFSGPVYAVSPSSGSLSGGSGGIEAGSNSTNYTYDAADRLTQVVQGVQTRTFVYDGLGRKVSETTPEGGTVTYSYTASGGALCSGDPSNVCGRTDARGVVSTYTYDHANRVTGVTYSIPGGKNIAPMPNVCTTTPNSTAANVCYYYDQGGAGANALGRLTEMVDPTGSESYSHDADGRMTQLAKVISGQTYTTGFQYDSGGDVTAITYPSGRVVQQVYNAVGQLCAIASSGSGCSASTYYAASFSYNAPGKLMGFTYGNGVTASFTYSANRTQLATLAYAKGTTTDLSLQYWYQKNSSTCPNGTVQDNGAIQCITDVENPGRSATYGYDLMGRLTSAVTTGGSLYPQWGLSETYDRFGNRWTQTVTAGSGPSSNMSFGSNGMNSSTTNQPNTYTYDASGNMTVEPFTPANDYTWDGENRMTGFSGSGGTATYSYDGNGMRVVKSVSGGTTTVTIFSGSSVIAEYDNGVAPTSPSREYIYNGAGDTTGLLAMISGGVTTYYHQDHLSVRLTTNASGAILTQEGHFPFGEAWYSSGPANNWYFTSYERDTESGLDYALARYFDSRTGMFGSADPLAGKPEDPQSWNRYAYGRNNPITITDPSGQSWWSDALSLIAAPFTGGASIFFGQMYDWAQDYAHDRPPSMPFSFGFTIGSSSGGVGGFGESLGLPASAPPVWAAGGPFSTLNRITSAIDLPNGEGCEFGACGAGPSAFGPGGPSQGPNPLSVTSGAISVSGIFPIFFGVLGPAVTVSYDPKNHLLCGGIGGGLSAGHTVGGGPVVVHAKPGNTSKDVLGGWSLSGGYNWTPWWGYQGSVNGSGYTAGYSFGVPGASGSVTYSWCRQGGS